MTTKPDGKFSGVRTGGSLTENVLQNIGEQNGSGDGSKSVAWTRALAHEWRQSRI